MSEFGAATLCLLSILLFWCFIYWFFGGYGRRATYHTRDESEAARQELIEKLDETTGQSSSLFRSTD